MQAELYTAAQGAIATQIQLDVIANNISNANTNGFREVSPFFRAFNSVTEKPTAPRNPLNYAVNSQPVLTGVYLHSQDGSLRETGNKLDLAIEGEGYFKVQFGQEYRYSRNGALALRAGQDGLSTLTNQSGYPILDIENREIRLDPTAGVLEIGRDGSVVQNGNQLAKIALLNFDNKTGLAPESDTLLVQTNPGAQELPASGTIRMGALETSNVNIARQMMDMMLAQRVYESNMRSIKTIDQNLNQTILQTWAPRR